MFGPEISDCKFIVYSGGHWQPMELMQRSLMHIPESALNTFLSLLLKLVAMGCYIGLYFGNIIEKLLISPSDSKRTKPQACSRLEKIQVCGNKVMKKVLLYLIQA